MAAEQLLCTPLEGLHEKLGASFTNFAGWRMPVRYTSDLAEHRAVRTSAGLFDLSHMGEVRVAGPQAGEALDHALAGKLSSVSVGRAKYSLLLTERGTVADDLVTYHVADDEYVVIPNAANVTTDLTAITERCSGFDVTVTDESTSTALIALQGPASAEILLRTLGRADTSLAPDEVRDLRYYRVLTGTWQGAAIMVARTGYTGEDGFELYVPNAQSEALWTSLQNASGEGVVPCGLACRDTLRLEAGMPLYGHELTTQTFPSQAGLGRVVSFKKESDFVGRSALKNRDESGDRVLVGLAGEGRRAARAGYAVKDAAGTEVGIVTSGILSPTLGHPIALAYVEASQAEVGTELNADVRGKPLPMTVVDLPFYTRS
ncbi:MAG: glycine cleavage system aminomethyltransferase GcvT [Cutibacterium granulosum]|uniref:glycine cleavage system aminomethyltransferase GcvT n=1 Tax=Cutibacterium granulosum TaxID=33011 RepID=UPI002B23C03C|nr:glycine cleavage system aminomethyltransferase GcvT [Cutibacterium granulosum]MEA5661037.1 glycine cleavage system aminomethyltransferase GcvT [Cutibacterium granulosum]